MMFSKTVRLNCGAPQTSLIVLGVYWRGLINAACGSTTGPTQTGGGEAWERPAGATARLVVDRV